MSKREKFMGGDDQSLQSLNIDGITDAHALMYEMSHGSREWTPEYIKKVSARIANRNSLFKGISNHIAVESLRQRAEAMQLLQIRNQGKLAAEAGKEASRARTTKRKRRTRKA